MCVRNCSYRIVISCINVVPRRTNHHQAAIAKPEAVAKKVCETAAPDEAALKRKAKHNLRSCTYKKALNDQLHKGVSLLIAKQTASEVAKEAIRDF